MEWIKYKIGLLSLRWELVVSYSPLKSVAVLGDDQFVDDLYGDEVGPLYSCCGPVINSNPCSFFVEDCYSIVHDCKRFHVAFLQNVARSVDAQSETARMPSSHSATMLSSSCSMVW